MTDDTDAVPAQVQDTIDTAFPERIVTGVDVAGPSWNDKNETARVEFEEGDAVYLKVAVDGDGSRIERECAVIDYVETHCDVGVPEVVASDTDHAPPYLVTAPMAGQNLVVEWSDRSVGERQDALRKVGAALADVHACTFETHGDVIGGDADGLELDAGAWADVLVEFLGVLRDGASTDRFDHHFEAVVAAVEENRELLNEAPATLVYGDPAHPNLFETGDGIGFIDWEIAHVGDPARELNRAYEQLGIDDDDQMKAALHEGYVDRAGSLPDGLEARAPVYDAIWHVHKSAVFDKYAEFADDPDDAEREHEAEMERLLDAVRTDG
jgi:aminoglycoside phosphotransferase (APT) family kinase protein